MMDDATIMALCVLSEAADQPLLGKQAVAQVILNRTRLKYQSDGTITGTVLAPNQFSGFWFAFISGKYTRVAWTHDDALHRAEAMLARAQHQAIWDVCLDVGTEATQGEMRCPDGLQHALLYLNPSIVPHLPTWAAPANRLAAIGQHVFFSDPTHAEPRSAA